MTTRWRKNKKSQRKGLVGAGGGGAGGKDKLNESTEWPEIAGEPSGMVSRNRGREQAWDGLERKSVRLGRERDREGGWGNAAGGWSLSRELER